MDILSYFDFDDTTYAAHDIVLYKFKDGRKDDFLREGVESYRKAFISDEELETVVREIGGTKAERIQEFIPTDPIIKSGDFGEILTYLIFSALHPEYNIKPLRWRWQEDVNRAVHFTDIMWLYCPDIANPQATDKMLTIEVKTRATNPGKESSINNAIEGALKDSITRDTLTLAYMKRQYLRDKQYEEAKVVERFEKSVQFPYYGCYNAVAVVDSDYLVKNHIANLDVNQITKVRSWNQANAANNKKMSLFVVPVKALKQLYQEMYQNVLSSCTES